MDEITMDDFLNSDDLGESLDTTLDSLDTFGIRENMVTVPVEKLDTISKAVTKLNNQAQRINPKFYIKATPLTETERNQQMTKQVVFKGESASRCYTISVKLIDVKVEYNVPTMQKGDYTYVAEYKMIDGQPLVNVHGDTLHNDDLIKQITEMAKTNKGQICDQCHTKRKRNIIYIFRKDSTGELVSLGAECARTYFGADTWNELVKYNDLINKLLFSVVSVDDSWYQQKIQQAAETCTPCGTMLGVLLAILKIEPAYNPKSYNYMAAKYFGTSFDTLPYGLTQSVPVTDKTWDDMLKFYQNYKPKSEFGDKCLSIGSTIAVNKGQTNERSAKIIEWALFLFANDYAKHGFTYDAQPAQQTQPAPAQQTAATYAVGDKVSGLKVKIDKTNIFSDTRYSYYGTTTWEFEGHDQNNVKIMGKTSAITDQMEHEIKVGNIITIKSGTVKAISSRGTVVLVRFKLDPNIEASQLQQAMGQAASIDANALNVLNFITASINDVGGIKALHATDPVDASEKVIGSINTKYSFNAEVASGHSRFMIKSISAISTDAALKIFSDIVHDDIDSKKKEYAFGAGNCSFATVHAFESQTSLVLQLNSMLKGNSKTVDSVMICANCIADILCGRASMPSSIFGIVNNTNNGVIVSAPSIRLLWDDAKTLVIKDSNGSISFYNMDDDGNISPAKI